MLQPSVTLALIWVNDHYIIIKGLNAPLYLQHKCQLNKIAFEKEFVPSCSYNSLLTEQNLLTDPRKQACKC